jgi:hypothetical protein
VDNDGDLEMILQCAAIGTTEKVICYKYDYTTRTFSYLWGYIPDEDSYSNTPTLFDFNQDGINEILISDQSRIRILDGRNGSTRTTLDFGQTTIMQYPVIADIDADGSADIVAVGLQSGSGATGRLNIFKSSTTPWAPARKVWNQYMYNAVNVNNDLTIPTVQLNPASTFAGDDRSLGTGDDVRPFNNYLQQQTILSQDGIPLGLTPNGEIIGSPTFVYDDIADEMIIILQMRNGGGAIFQNPFYVTAYKGNIGNTTKQIYTYSNTIGINETVTFQLQIPNFSNDWLPYSSIIVKVNDKGDGIDDQDVCDDLLSQYTYYGVLPTDQDVCAGNVKEMTCSFNLSSNDTYQWQSSKNNVTWTDISGATVVSYTPVDQKRGVVYYRVVVTNDTDTETVNSESVRLKVRSCLLPVNHNISVMGYYD